jgi:hypothetical protein
MPNQKPKPATKPAPKPEKAVVKRRAPGKRAKRDYTWRGEQVQLAADIAGVSKWMVYKVLNNAAKSERVERALELARQRLARQKARRPAA